MKIALAVALALFLLPQAKAAEPLPAEDAPATVDAAATFALSRAYFDHPHYYEYGGVIVRMPNGKFNPSAPRTDGHATNVEIDTDYEVYEGNFPVVADYHTHPCLDGYVPEVFSPADLSSARGSKQPGYILDECTGDIHYWAPGDAYDKIPGEEIANSLGINIARTSHGTIVGHINVDGIKIKL